MNTNVVLKIKIIKILEENWVKKKQIYQFNLFQKCNIAVIMRKKSEINYRNMAICELGHASKRVLNDGSLDNFIL